MAYTHPQQGHVEEAAQLRKKAGQYLQGLRLRADLTQNELAKRVGFEYYTMISQIELGKARVPPDRIQDYADAVGVNVKTLGKRLLQYYDPFMWNVLFGNPDRK